MTECADMFLVHCYTKFHIPCPNGSLVITIKLEIECIFCMTAILLFYILQKRVTLTKVTFSVKISGTYIKWCYCYSLLKSFQYFYDDTDVRQLKSTNSVSCCVMFIPSFSKTCQLFQSYSIMKGLMDMVIP